MIFGMGRSFATVRQRHRRMIAETLRGNVLGMQLLDYLGEHPVVTVRMIERKLGCTFATANKLVDHFQRLEILKKVSHAG
jgi:hypothetical protein